MGSTPHWPITWRTYSPGDGLIDGWMPPTSTFNPGAIVWLPQFTGCISYRLTLLHEVAKASRVGERSGVARILPYFSVSAYAFIAINCGKRPGPFRVNFTIAPCAFYIAAPPTTTLTAKYVHMIVLFVRLVSLSVGCILIGFHHAFLCTHKGLPCVYGVSCVTDTVMRIALSAAKCTVQLCRFKECSIVPVHALLLCSPGFVGRVLETPW